MSEITKLSIEGSWLFNSPVHSDDRGYFREWFKADEILKNTGRNFNVAQSNLSRSKKGVVRGIHFSKAPQGQAKWITCAHGAIWDVIVDIRPDSPTFKKWQGIELKEGDGQSILISEGLGHAFLALEDDSVISYLLTTPYAPEFEFSINPQDTEIGIKWPIRHLKFSTKDEKAPFMKDYLESF